MSGEKVLDVMDLFGGLEAKPKKAEPKVEAVAVEPSEPKPEPVKVEVDTEKLYMLEPRFDLINPLEPGFVDGVSYTGPSGSIITKEMIRDALLDGENIHLYGDAGTGKSTLARAILDMVNAETISANAKTWVRNKEALKKNPELTAEELEPYSELPYPMTHYSSHEGTRSEQLMGKPHIVETAEGRKIIELLGPLVDAYENGKVLIWEEFDFTPPSILGEAHLFMETSSKEAHIYINEPRIIRRSTRYGVIGTSNTLGAGEAATEFAGTQPLNSAFMSRFTFTVKVGWLPAKEEEKLIKNRTSIHVDLVKKMIKVASKIRKAYDEEQVEKPISTRALLSWAREIRRATKRIGVAKVRSMDKSTLWREVAIPSADSTILANIADPVSRDAVTEAINLY
jgi:MoxR-like ATPase